MQLYVLIHIIFLALSLLLKYSLFLSSTPVLTSSIDVVFVLSMEEAPNYWLFASKGGQFNYV